jgi:hypothetical protein
MNSWHSKIWNRGLIKVWQGKHKLRDEAQSRSSIHPVTTIRHFIHPIQRTDTQTLTYIFKLPHSDLAPRPVQLPDSHWQAVFGTLVSYLILEGDRRLICAVKVIEKSYTSKPSLHLYTSLSL